MLVKLLKVSLGNKRGSSLIELVTVAAIIGMLTSIAIPSDNTFIHEAEERVNQINAKTLSNIAYIIKIETGEFPAWPSTFKGLSPEEANNMIDKTIEYKGKGCFRYDKGNGVILPDPE